MYNEKETALDAMAGDGGYSEGTRHGYLGAVMRRNGKRFWAGDNISDYVREEDIPQLIDEATEAFDKFYMRNRTRRFRCFKGEYMYHQLSWRNNWPDWKYIDSFNLDIEYNDAVVVSMPFADTGGVHSEYHELMSKCSSLGVPVLIDSAYFGMCAGIDFIYNYDCITDIAFSLSKTFPVANLRIGMRLTRVDDDDSAFVYHKTNYTNRISAGIGLGLMNQFFKQLYLGKVPTGPKRIVSGIANCAK